MSRPLIDGKRTKDSFAQLSEMLVDLDAAINAALDAHTRGRSPADEKEFYQSMIEAKQVLGTVQRIAILLSAGKYREAFELMRVTW